MGAPTGPCRADEGNLPVKSRKHSVEGLWKVAVRNNFPSPLTSSYFSVLQPEMGQELELAR